VRRAHTMSFSSSWLCSCRSACWSSALVATGAAAAAGLALGDARGLEPREPAAAAALGVAAATAACAFAVSEPAQQAVSRHAGRTGVLAAAASSGADAGAASLRDDAEPVRVGAGTGAASAGVCAGGWASAGAATPAAGAGSGGGSASSSLYRTGSGICTATRSTTRFAGGVNAARFSAAWYRRKLPSNLASTAEPNAAHTTRLAAPSREEVADVDDVLRGEDL
jgi:hypothetical protein